MFSTGQSQRVESQKWKRIIFLNNRKSLDQCYLFLRNMMETIATREMSIASIFFKNHQVKKKTK